MSSSARTAIPTSIVGGKPGAHLVNLKKPWQRIRKQAGLEDVRLHDLRHSFASVAVGLGESLHMTGKLLGHSQTQTTQRYAHLADDPVKAATERVGAAISGMMAGEAGEVVPIRGGAYQRTVTNLMATGDSSDVPKKGRKQRIIEELAFIEGEMRAWGQEPPDQNIALRSTSLTDP